MCGPHEQYSYLRQVVGVCSARVPTAAAGLRGMVPDMLLDDSSKLHAPKSRALGILLSKRQWGRGGVEYRCIVGFSTDSPASPPPSAAVRRYPGVVYAVTQQGGQDSAGVKARLLRRGRPAGRAGAERKVHVAVCRGAFAGGLRFGCGRR